MVELKLAGAVLVAVSAALLGITLQNDMKYRVELLQEFYKGILLIHQEIDYLKMPLEETSQRVGRSLKEPLASFFRETGTALEELPGTPFSQVWEEKEKRYLSGEALKPEDFELIRQLGRQLENLEQGGSGGLLDMFEQRMEASVQEAKEEYRSKAQLYGRLGIMGGVFLVILLL